MLACLAVLVTSCAGGKGVAAHGSTTNSPNSTVALVPTTLNPTLLATQQLASALLIPAGFAPSLTGYVTSLGMSPADFDNKVGRTGAAASFGLVAGYDEPLDQADGTHSIEVFLTQFTTTAQAVAFGQILLAKREKVLSAARRSVARSVFEGIPGAVAINYTRAATGDVFERAVYATKDVRVMAISYTAPSAADLPQLDSIAIDQYRRL
jgi:hypothetical protein